MTGERQFRRLGRDVIEQCIRAEAVLISQRRKMMRQGETIELGLGRPQDIRALRSAFGCFSTGVTIVTACAPDGRRVGLTANSFTSVSLDPPLALACIDSRSASLAVLEDAGAFAVNVLHAEQQEVAKRFTCKMADRFDGLDVDTWRTGAPILAGCMANFDCELDHVFSAGDHRVCIGRVVKLSYNSVDEPLIFIRGRYRRVYAEDLYEER
jgi:flavin reductase (DIM6/NTAB) family NADH-FMN oxidoreductase RutF